MKNCWVFIFLSAFLLASLTVYAAEPESIGSVKTIKNRVYLVRNGKTLDAAHGMKIWIGDTIKTGAEGSIGLVFRDDTMISMGPDSALVIDAFLFEPVDGELSFLSRMLRGTVSFISGQIAKLSPGAVQLQTPDATIGMRGTHVLAKVGEQ